MTPSHHHPLNRSAVFILFLFYEKSADLRGNADFCSVVLSCQWAYTHSLIHPATVLSIPLCAMTWNRLLPIGWMSPQNAVTIIRHTFLSITITFVAFAYMWHVQLNQFCDSCMKLRLFPLTDFLQLYAHQYRTRSAMAVACHLSDYKSGPNHNESWTALLQMVCCYAMHG